MDATIRTRTHAASKDGAGTRLRRTVTATLTTAMLTLGLTVGLAVPAAADTTAAPATARSGDCGPFTDVPTGAAHCADIAWFATTGVSQGYSDGTFRPDSAVSRGAMAAFFYRISHSTGTDAACSSEPFRDVSATGKLCGDIAWLADSGITTGYSDGTFRPDSAVSRGAMAAFLYRFTHSGAQAPHCTTAPYSDVSVHNDFCGAITWLSHRGIAYGYRNASTYAPSRVLTRGVMAAFLHRLATTNGLQSTSSALSVSFRSDSGHGETIADGGDFAAFDAAFVQLVNAARTSRGIRPLQPSMKLARIAESWSATMAHGGTGGNLEHNPDYFDTLSTVCPSWHVAGENVARFTTGAYTVKQVFDAYMNSPSHRANILNDDYRYIGLRSVADPTNTFNTMDFSSSVR